ncbi:MAG: heparinase II/III family protein [Myxococcota bacterium]
MKLAWLGAAILCGACGDAATSGDDATGDARDGADGVATSDGAVVEDSTPAEVEPDATADVEPEVAADTGPDDAADAAPDVTTDAATEVGPVIDPNGDTDGDGIFDLDEVAAGTDPFDPRSASAWHPELGEHPRLFVAPADRATMLARSQAASGPAATLWARIASLAAQTPPSQPAPGAGAVYDTGLAPQQGRIAEAAAALAWVQQDESMAEKALTILAAPFPDPTPLNQRSPVNAGDHYDLLEAEALVPMCSAWDLLAADEASHDPTLFAAARARLVERIDLYRGLCFDHGGCSALLRNEPDNHAAKALSALGVCAMALPDRATAAADFNEAVAGLRWIFDEAQGNAEGGWAESWNYLSYSGESHLPFLLAWHHLARGATWPALIKGAGWATWRDPLKNQLQHIPDFAVDPVLVAVYQKALMAALPDGRTPPVDDANASALHGGALAALFDDARFVWNWQLPAVGLASGQVTVPTFFAFDPDMAAVAPDWPLDGFFADAGFSVLRSDLGPDALYIEVQHEKDRMRSMGGAHEHADPLSFVLYAFGEQLAVDPGYIDFSHHGEVKYGKDHNIVLVDGQGPEFFLDGLVDLAPNSDAFLHEHGALGPHTTLIASTKYAGAELRRRFVRLGQRALVVADGLVEDGSHSYTWQLNGYASETLAGTSFTRVDALDVGAARGVWQRATAGMLAQVAATEGTVVAADRLEESLGQQGLGTHRCLTLEAPMGASAGFVALIVPYAGTSAPSVSESGRGATGVAWVRVGDDVAILNRGASTSSLTIAGAARSAPPGLTILDLGSGEAWTASMETPPIPDPAPFIPE